MAERRERISLGVLAWGGAVAAAMLLPWEALALEIENAHSEPAKVVIERWVQFMNPGDTAFFIPRESPTLIKIELSHVRLQCTASSEDLVRLASNNCYVNGELAGEGQFRM